MDLKFKFGGSMHSLPWKTSLGIVVASGADQSLLQPAVNAASSRIGKQETSNDVARRIRTFDSFFAENHSRSPLGEQFEMVRRKGLPPGNVLVQALLLSEMSTGLLMGAQDASAIEGALVCDLANSGDSFQGMRNEVRCQPGEIILKDDKSVIASLLQGPDHRTKLRKNTRDVVFFVFSVPGIDANEIEEGVRQIGALFEGTCADLSMHTYVAGMGTP